MAYSPMRNLAYRIIFKLADFLGFWRHPANIDIENLSSFWRMAYWFYAAGRPVVRAEKGSQLEKFFAEHRQPVEPLLLANFQPQTTFTMSAVGDLMCNDATEQSVGKFYTNVANLIFDADIRLANLESSLTSGPIIKTAITDKDLPKINASKAQFDVIKGHADKYFDVFQTANNHIMDHGLEGLETTHTCLESEGFRYVGTNRSRADQDKGLIIEKNGIKLGLVAATWGINNRALPNGAEYAVNIVRFHQKNTSIDLSLLEKQMAWCRNQGCDIVIAYLHWGCEWEFYPRQAQVQTAHELAEKGADIIIGHHAHVIQPMEWYRPRRDVERQIPIFYNLGNLAALLKAPYSALSLVANLTIAKGQINGQPKTFVQEARLTPVIQIDRQISQTMIVQIELLRDLLQNSAEPAAQQIARAASFYADLALGSDWRRG